MDNLTHSLTGLALSRAGLNRFYPRASLLLILAANTPDIDGLSLFAGPLSYMNHHRGLAHSITLAPLMAVLPLLVLFAIARSASGWKAAYVLSLIGVGSHLLIDWTNAYAVHLLLPFSSRWLHSDLNVLYDLWIWAALLIAAIGPAFGRIVSSEIGARSGSGRALAIAALSFFALYDFGRYLAHRRAIAELNARIYDGVPAIRTAAFPRSAANPLLWTGWVEGQQAMRRYDLDLSSEFDPTSGERFPRLAPTAAMEAARQTTPFRDFLRFSIYPFWLTTPAEDPEGGTRVDLHDARFPFAASAVVDKWNRVQRAWFHY